MEKLREHSSPTASRWREKAEYRQANLGWLKESRRIAIEILSKMRVQGITRKQLSEMTGISDEALSRILRGKDKVNEETVRQIETALEM